VARIDVSSILIDPDFLDELTLIKRASSINQYGEHVMTETSCKIRASVQSVGTEDIERLPEGARLHDTITVYYCGELFPERANGYADVLVWGGKRYQVSSLAENFMNFGRGFTKAICRMEDARA
jgi:hypothetical protein